MTKRFAIVKGEVVDCVVISENPLEIDGLWIDLTGLTPEPGRDWTYQDGVFSPPPPPPPPPPTWVITKVAMISRFTPEEYVGIVGATKTDVEVQAWYDLFQAASVVDLQDPRTIAGINSLATKNLITEARAEEILTTPAQDSERP